VALLVVLSSPVEVTPPAPVDARPPTPEPVASALDVPLLVPSITTPVADEMLLVAGAP
jgi:hypothetical protein